MEKSDLKGCMTQGGGGGTRGEKKCWRQEKGPLERLVSRKTIGIKAKTALCCLRKGREIMKNNGQYCCVLQDVRKIDVGGKRLVGLPVVIPVI